MPHLNIAIAGLGVAGLSDQVYMLANSENISVIHELSDRLPEFLRGFWAHLHDKFGPTIPDGATSTVYIFGFDDGAPYGYAHELTSGFMARKIPEHAIGAKPTDDLVKEDLAINTLEDYVFLMRKIKAAQDRRPIETRLHIGGSIQFTNVTPKGLSTMMANGLLD